MNTSAMKIIKPQRQSGAALVIALILLVALTLMAISSMNTASLDLIMAGNEQYRSRAFVTAEAGIEHALAGGTFDTSLPLFTASGMGADNDTYSYDITLPNEGALEPPPTGYSTGQGASSFGLIYFRIKSTATSERGTKAVSTQELYEVVKSNDSTTCDTTLASSCAID